jgi:hypothetical protein
VEIWIAAALVGVIVAGIVLRRSSRASASEVDLGQVSESWLTETRANKSER